MNQDFSVNIEKNKECTTILCNGDIDLNSIQPLQKMFSSIQKNEKTILNLTNATFIDSAGLGIIAKHAKIYKENNNPLQINCLENYVYKVFKLSNLEDTILNISITKL